MKEIALKIRLYPDPVLRNRAKKVLRVTEREQEVLSGMAQLMYSSSGIGLAAPQVGIDEAMITVDIGSGLYKLVNPRIVKREGAQAMDEGCLSVPGVCIKVKRAEKIVVESLDDNGKPQRIEAQGLFACVLQHEIDHLRGKLIIDHASIMDRLKIKLRLDELKKRAEDENLSKPETKSCQLQL